MSVPWFYVNGVRATRHDAFARFAASGQADPAEIEAIFETACQPTVEGETCRDLLLDAGVEIVLED